MISLQLQVRDAFGDTGFNFTLHYGADRKHTKEMPSSRSRTIGSLGLSHGDLLYLQSLNNSITADSLEAGPSSRRERQNSVSSVSSIGMASNSKSNVEEDKIDIQLWGEDGKIQRGRDSKL